MTFTTLIGLVAALCTTASYFPQLKKCWETRSAGDLSLKMFGVLAFGIALWVLYGFLQNDIIIVIANAVSFLLLRVSCTSNSWKCAAVCSLHGTGV